MMMINPDENGDEGSEVISQTVRENMSNNIIQPVFPSTQITPP